jgi:hypothetical protein
MMDHRLSVARQPRSGDRMQPTLALSLSKGRKPWVNAGYEKARKKTNQSL